MKKFKKIILGALLLLVFTVCTKVHNENAIRFKSDYEALNGVETKTQGKYYRSITIDEDNPFVYTNLDDINKRIENKESFIVYFGANWCPWCRSVLPTFISACKEEKIKTVYYIDVRPDNDTEKEIRDVYSLDKKNKPYISHEGTEAYHKFLEYANDVLSDYNNHGVKVEGVKRVGAPNYILVKDGKVIKKINGISSKQTDGYMELTEEMNKEMKDIFKEFITEFKK